MSLQTAHAGARSAATKALPTHRNPGIRDWEARGIRDWEAPGIRDWGLGIRPGTMSRVRIHVKAGFERLGEAMQHLSDRFSQSYSLGQ
jgi:hypothetical protein